MLVVEGDGAKGAPRGAGAEAPAVVGPGVAGEVLAVGGEGGHVAAEGGVELVALVHLVDLVGALARRVGAGADEDLFFLC